MKNLDIKDLLELFSTMMINKKKVFFRKEITGIVPMSEKSKFINEYKNNVNVNNGIYTVSEKPGTVTTVPAYNYFVLYDMPFAEESKGRIKNLRYYFEGFELYAELKERIQDKAFNTGQFAVYVKDCFGYRLLQHNVFYEEEYDKWTDLYIPCLGEIYDVEIVYNGDENTKVTQEMMTGVFCSQEDIENYIQEVIVFEEMLKHKPFVITGEYRYEGVMNEFRAEYDEMVSSFESWSVDEENSSQYLSAYDAGYTQGIKKGYILRLEEEETESDTNIPAGD